MSKSWCVVAVDFGPIPSAYVVQVSKALKGERAEIEVGSWFLADDVEAGEADVYAWLAKRPAPGLYRLEFTPAPNEEFADLVVSNVTRLMDFPPPVRQKKKPSIHGAEDLTKVDGLWAMYIVTADKQSFAICIDKRIEALDDLDDDLKVDTLVAAVAPRKRWTKGVSGLYMVRFAIVEGSYSNPIPIVWQVERLRAFPVLTKAAGKLKVASDDRPCLVYEADDDTLARIKAKKAPARIEPKAAEMDLRALHVLADRVSKLEVGLDGLLASLRNMSLDYRG